MGPDQNWVRWARHALDKSMHQANFNPISTGQGPHRCMRHDVRVQTMDFEVAFELYLRTVEKKKIRRPTWNICNKPGQGLMVRDGNSATETRWKPRGRNRKGIRAKSHS
ncbi:hypothetical protein D623_10008180 [Myotis brandtii]|uniref:Uncharacterized protein n=1 Tax=Myotis brandtii TaxID=109478 RepID=S7ME56_MYOBR|nr:hypothetical protein D623_10008180 [Myotis brandtii]